jgi:hypothetical protein
MKDVLQRAHQAAEGPEAAKLWGDFLQKMRDILSKILADAEEKYNAGDRRQLFTAIQMSALLSVPAPKWAEDALARAGLGGPLETWDDVFGRPAGPPDSAGKRKRPEKRRGRVRRHGARNSKGLRVLVRILQKADKDFLKN